MSNLQLLYAYIAIRPASRYNSGSKSWSEVPTTKHLSAVIDAIELLPGTLSGGSLKRPLPPGAAASGVAGESATVPASAPVLSQRPSLRVGPSSSSSSSVAPGGTGTGIGSGGHHQQQLRAAAGSTGNVSAASSAGSAEHQQHQPPTAAQPQVLPRSARALPK